MGLAVRLVSPALRVVPGETATTEVRIRNTGHLVDRADLDVLGEAAAWAAVDPPYVNLLPGQEETVRVGFAPPRSFEVRAGERPFAVRAASREDPGGSAVEEGVLTVAQFDLVVAELVPQASRGPRVGRHHLAIDNLSNHPLTLRLLPSDPDSLLEFFMDAQEFEAPPGTATFVRVRARPTTRFLRGSERQMPFQIAISADDVTPPVVVPGSVRQHAILPAWLFRAAVLLVIVSAIWVALLKPQLDSTVQEVAQEEAVKVTAPLAPKVAQLAAQDTAEKADQAQAAADAAGSKGGKDTGTAPTPGSGSQGPPGPPGPAGAKGERGPAGPLYLPAGQAFLAGHQPVSTAWGPIGLAVELPSAGTYAIRADVRGQIEIPKDAYTNCWIRIRLFDVFAEQPVKSSERIIMHVKEKASAHPDGVGRQATGVLEHIVTVDRPTRIRVEAGKPSGCSGASRVYILDDDNGRTTMSFLKIEEPGARPAPTNPDGTYTQPGT
jgi:hypothetical protein